MSETYVTKVNGNFIAASEVRPGSPLATKLANLLNGAFEIASLDSTTGKPAVASPSTKIIYLTKSSTAGLEDPYTEWIYTESGTWEIIGETSVNLSNYVNNLTQSGSGYVSNVQKSGNTITVTKTALPTASTSAAGIVQLAGSIGATVSSENNKAATEKAVRDAINDLDVASITGTGAGKTLATLSETDGKISATFQDISITKSQVSDFPTDMTPSSHTHGYITNDGKITASGSSDSFANGDTLVFVDASANSTVKKSSITFDGTTTTQFLSKKGTWETTTSANDGKLKIQINGGTATSKFTANQSSDSTITFATGTNNGTIKVDGTEVAVAGLGSAAYTATTDYATAAQGAKADSAIQGVICKATELTPDSSTKKVTIPEATNEVYGVVTVTTEEIA